MKLNAEFREEIGKNKVNKLRKNGLVPACLYRRGEETKHVKIDTTALNHALHTKAGENVILDIVVTGDKSKAARPVMIKEVQYHPIKDNVLHVDFNEISLTEKITVNVPIVTKGEATAVTKESGAIEHIMWELEVECLPTEIPEKIEVDVTELVIGDKIHVKDLPVPPGVIVQNDPELTVLSAEPPHIEEVVEEVVEGEEGTEPEVITKGKKEEEGEEGEAPAKEEKAEGKKEEGKK